MPELCEELKLNNVERYEALLRAALEAQQLKIELNKKLAEVAKNITANELKHRRFDKEDAQKAFAILAESMIEIKEKESVKAAATYKDVEIYLHCLPQNLSSDAMKRVLNELTSNEIFEA